MNEKNNFGRLYSDLHGLMDDHGELHTAIMFAAALFTRIAEDEKRKAEEVKAWCEQANRNYMKLAEIEKLRIEQQLRNNNNR